MGEGSSRTKIRLPGDLYFGGRFESDGGEGLRFNVVDPAGTKGLAVPRGLYDQLAKVLAKKLSDRMLNKWLRVDFAFASSLMK